MTETGSPRKPEQGYATIGVRFRLNPVNGWFIRAFASPFASIGGREVPAVWSTETLIDVPAGDVRVAVYFRYRGIRADLGTGACRMRAEAGTIVHLVARNGAMNQTPFRVRPEQSPAPRSR